MRILLTISYDGTDFCGYQIQPNGRTVEEVLNGAIEKLTGEKYAMFKGLNWFKGVISPHYGTRMLDFDEIVCYNYDCAFGLEDNAAIVLENGELVGSVSSGGKAWKIERKEGMIVKTEVPEL